MTPMALPAPRARSRWVALAVPFGFAAAAAAFMGGFLVFATGLERSETGPAHHADGIVALTGGAERVGDALGLLLAGQGERLLISGVNPATSAAELIRATPDARRLLDCCIELGYGASDTIGNARETRGWARRHGVRTLIVVTSNYHMPRALAEMADANPSVQLVPFAVVSDRPALGSRAWLGRLRLEFVEYVKLLVVLARTHLHPADPPAAEAAAASSPPLV